MTHSQNVINCFNTTLKVIKTWDYPNGNYMFKVNNRNTKTKCEICSKLAIKTPKRRRIYDPFKYLLGDSWNYMPPILVPSSAKHITTQILVIAKLNETEDFILTDFFSVISSVPTRNYLSKVSNWNTRVRCENCSRLRMKTLERSVVLVSVLLTVNVFQTSF